MIPTTIQPIPPEFARASQAAREDAARFNQQRRQIAREMEEAAREQLNRAAAACRAEAERHRRAAARDVMDSVKADREAMTRAAREGILRPFLPPVTDADRRAMSEWARVFRGQPSPPPVRRHTPSPYATHVALAHPTR